MWRELPADTKWFEVELTAKDLDRVRFFPRAQWRRVAEGSFYMKDVVEQLRARLGEPGDDQFLAKLRFLTASVNSNAVQPTVLLIGVDGKSPLTILDGNHRMAAALLAQRIPALGNFRFICGFSPQMVRCCWYHTNVNTLLRYLRNVVRYFTYHPEADIGRFQERHL